MDVVASNVEYTVTIKLTNDDLTNINLEAGNLKEESALGVLVDAILGAVR